MRMIEMGKRIEMLDERFDEAFWKLDAMTRQMFIEGVMKEDNITREQALDLIENNAMYSMGLKWALYRNRAKMDLRKSRKQKKQEFLDSLTPDEMEWYLKGPAQNRWARRKMEKDAEKAAKADAEELKRKMENGEISDEDIPEWMRNV